MFAQNRFLRPKSRKTIKMQTKQRYRAPTARKNGFRRCSAKFRAPGKTEVMITYESTSEKVTVADTKTSKSSSGEEKNESSGERVTVMQKDGNASSPFVKAEVNPKVRGVLVVADGAKNADVSANLKKAVCAVLDVPIHKVEVMPREK